MRIQLDIPENQLGEATQLLLWREQLLRVYVEPVEKEGSLEFLGNLDL